MTDDRIAAPIATRLGHLIKGSEQALIGKKAQALRGVGLTVPQYVAMLSLAEAPAGLTGAQLARRCMVTPQSMTTPLATLETKQLITRTPSEVHANVLIVRLTPRGERLLRDADQEGMRVEDRLASAFTEQELDLFRDFLRRATAAMQKDE